MTEIKLKTYTLRGDNNEWLGQIILSSDGVFASVTDYGNLSYAWRSFGAEDFRKFITVLSAEYLAGKLQNGFSYIAYSKKTMQACKLFSEKILPPLQKILKEELSQDIDW